MYGWLASLPAIASVVSGFIDFYNFVKDILSSTSSHKEQPPLNLTIVPPQEPVERYQTLLGKRHKFLRKDILKLSEREMADFYGFEKTKYLEDCEAGLDEFSTVAMKRLVQVFFINPQYLLEGKTPIFQSFVINDTTKDCRRFLELGFHPYFLCVPNFAKYGEGEYGDAHLAFCKKEGEYWRMIQSNTTSNFYSSGGGARNVDNLIDPMLDLGLSPTWLQISFLNVRPEDWKKLSDGCYYDTRIQYTGAANYQARDIFEGWFAGREETRKRWNRS